MLKELSGLIVERLSRDIDKLREDFAQTKSVPTRFVAIDDVLPEEIARRAYEAFPKPEQMRFLSSFRERKYTSKALEKFDPFITDVTFAFQSPEVIKVVAGITGIQDMSGDPHLYAGGISTMARGHFLNPHIDNSHDHKREQYRVLNLLYYVNPGWKSEFGGNLELWDEQVRHRVEIPSLFNRLVIMETNQLSWHSVNTVKVDEKRCCVSNYYFSPHSPNDGNEVFHVTFFQGRPEQPLRRLLTTADSYLRTGMRRFVKGGLGRKDLYEPREKVKG